MPKDIEIIDVGNTVLCDDCNKDWSNSDKSGGFLFGSHAICPDCAPRMMEQITAYKEEWYIKGTCPEGVSFKDWVLSLRGGDNTIKIIKDNAHKKPKRGRKKSAGSSPK